MHIPNTWLAILNVFFLSLCNYAENLTLNSYLKLLCKNYGKTSTLQSWSNNFDLFYLVRRYVLAKVQWIPYMDIPNIRLSL